MMMTMKHRMVPRMLQVTGAGLTALVARAVDQCLSLELSLSLSLSLSRQRAACHHHKRRQDQQGPLREAGVWS